MPPPSAGASFLQQLIGAAQAGAVVSLWIQFADLEDADGDEWFS